jgi:hypothetical protein
MTTFDPEDWVDRIHKAGGRIRVDGTTMYPTPNAPLTPECEAIWREIQGDPEKWSQAEALVRKLVVPSAGWADF